MNDIIKISKGPNTYDLHVMWSIHNKCNYSCSYCPETLHNGDWQWLNLERLKGFIDKVENHYVKILGFKNILFSFTGGEPTLWKDFKAFVKYIDQKGFRCGLTTNASVAPHFWNDIAHIFDYIAFSFHPERADSEKFLETFKSLHDNPNSVTPSVRVMMHKDDVFWKKSERLINQLKSFKNWSYECVHILDEYGTDSTKIDYDSDKKTNYLLENSFNEQFLDPDMIKLPNIGFNYNYTTSDNSSHKLNENELINNNQVNFENWNCFIGVESLFIHFSGDVKTAGCGAGKTLGNILFFEKIRFPTKPIVCNQKACLCPTDVRITKSALNQGLDYKLNSSDGTLVSVGSNESAFKNRLFINLSPQILLDNNLTLNEYVELTNELIKKIGGKDSLCTYIEIDSDFNIDKFDTFYKTLSNIQGFKVLLTNNFGDSIHNYPRLSTNCSLKLLLKKKKKFLVLKL